MAHEADVRSQQKSLITADAWGESWTDEEVAMMIEFKDDRDEDVAIALGRTVYAVRALRTRLAAPRAARTVSGARLPSQTIAITDYAAWEASFA